jgi:hypothetical protein
MDDPRNSLLSIKQFDFAYSLPDMRLPYVTHPVKFCRRAVYPLSLKPLT